MEELNCNPKYAVPIVGECANEAYPQDVDSADMITVRALLPPFRMVQPLRLCSFSRLSRSVPRFPHPECGSLIPMLFPEKGLLCLLSIFRMLPVNCTGIA